VASRPGEEANPVAIRVSRHQFAEALWVGLGGNHIGLMTPQPEMGGVEIDHLETETPAAAGIAGSLSAEDGHPGITCLEQGIAVIDHPHQHPKPQDVAVPVNHLRPLGCAKLYAEKRWAMMDGQRHRYGHGSGGQLLALGYRPGDSATVPWVVPGSPAADQ
jgi:hypothetical protein